MSFFEKYEEWRNKSYGEEKGYTPDVYLGAALNSLEKKMVDELLPDGYQAHLRETAPVFVPEKNQYVRNYELAPDPAQLQGNWQRRFIPGGMTEQLTFGDPLANAYAQVAYQRANMQLAGWREGPVYPEVEGIWDRYPGVDPAGKYCEKDMDFARRLATLKTASEALDPQHKAALHEAFEMLQEPHGALEDVLGQTKQVFNTVRETQRAAKLCPNKQVSELMEAGANQRMNGAACVQRLDNFYTALEHMAGLRQGPPTQQVLRSAQEFRLNQNMVATPPTLGTPKSVKVEFPNMENIIQQSRFVHPANWGKKPNSLNQDLNDPIKASNYVEKYAGGIGKRALDGIFGNSAQQLPGVPGFDRAGLIVVDGMTVAERMKKEYGKGNGLPPYEQWFAANSQKKSAQYVSAALMAGKRVEVYKPMADGTLSQAPISVTAKGYAPTPEKPTLLNAWEKFWNKFGFYKQKAAQAKADQQSMDAQKRVHEGYANARHTQGSDKDFVENMFFSDYLHEKGFANVTAFGNSLANGSAGKRLSYGRTALQSFCIGIMASQDVPIEDIMDPSKLRQEKQQVGRMLMERLACNPELGTEGIKDTMPKFNPEKMDMSGQEAFNTRTGDAEWLGKMGFVGQQGLMRQINRIMHGVDMTNDSRMQQVAPALQFASEALFDIHQDIWAGTRNGRTTDTYQSYTNQVGANAAVENRRELADAFNSRVKLVAAAGKALADGYEARSQIDRPNHTVNSMRDTLKAYVMGQATKDVMTAAAGRCFTDRIPDEHTYGAIFGGATLMCQPGGMLDQLGTKAFNDPKVRADLGAAARDGKLAKAMDIKLVPTADGKPKLSVAPAKNIVKSVPKAAPQMGR